MRKRGFASRKARRFAVAGTVFGLVLAVTATSAFACTRSHAGGRAHGSHGSHHRSTTTSPPTSSTAPPTSVTSTTVAAPATTSTSVPPATVTTIAAPTTTTPASTGGGGDCTKPIASTSEARGAIDVGGGGKYQVRNEAWSDSHGPQTVYACSEQSWYVVSNQPDNGGAVQTYPDSLYSISGSKPISQYTSMTSTFAEAYPAQGNWNAAYDIWMNDWSKEVMIWNEWNGGPGYWPTQAKTAVVLGGVPYHFANNDGELMFFRDSQVKSGSVDILAALKWLVSRGFLKAPDVPTQVEYGVEICSTVGTQTFRTTGFTFASS